MTDSFDHAAPVSSFPAGKTVRLCFMGLDEPTCARLRELGVREGCDACVMATGDKCVLGLGAARVALRREVAMGLFATDTSR
ncbi:iron transporter FeoA [Rubrivirga sp. SAORIC476]|uniref:FeoA family protein n=1 Tax=Rubrivirga sp. SAORIC476 TaxID=1961794 RepID=UPI000BDAED2C|nr:FeoA family protein [Rubrivirga sp. SAORIC476]PAP80458.1 iron transporter FeoA [Rubrivirga sp. SAORIC476]